MPGRYLIVDLTQEPPALVTTDDVLPQVIVDALAQIDAKLEQIMTDMASGQAQIQNLADGINAVSSHVSSARDMLANWIAQNQSAALDFTPALNALASVQAAAGTLDNLVPQAPSDPIQPVPAPPDPATDPTTPVTDPSTPPLDTTTPDPSVPPIDPTVASDPSTTPDGGTPTPVQ